MAERTGAVDTGFYAEARRWATSGRAAIAIRGGAWSVVGYGATQLLRMATTLVLARHLLGPEAFGLVGLVAVFVAGLSMFSELGLMANVVQHPRGDDPRFLNTAFSIQAARGLSIWVVAALASYPFALFYKQPELFPLVVVAALSEMIRGLTNTAVWTLTRHVNLRGITLLTVAAELVAFGVAILWALMSPSAWALVARTIAHAAVYVAGSHFIAGRRVTFGWERGAAGDILRFGGWISISTATYFLGTQSERLLLGKFVTPAELGCFSLALMITLVPGGGINQLMGQVFLPMISKTARTDRRAMVRDFQKVRRIFFFVTVLLGAGFLAYSKRLVALLLPPQYAMTGWMLQLLGLRVALDVFAAPTSSVILACGEAKYSMAFNTARLTFMISGVWIAFTHFGIREAVGALVIAQALSYFALIPGVARLLPGVAGTELRWYAATLALLTLAAVLPWPWG